MKQTRNAVIVGAGPGGLAAALLLAKSGVKVTIVEKRGEVGGRTSTLEQDGFKFDIGPTFFLYPRVLKEIFASAGYDLDREVPMTRLDPQYRLVFGAGGELLATPNVERMEKAIANISPEDAARFHKFITHNRVKLDKFLPFLQAPFESWRDLMKPSMMKLLPLLAPWRSLDSDLQVHFKDERIRLGFSFQSKYLGMSPFRCPSLFSILSFLEYEHGVFHPTGGCGAVTRAMARIATELGVEILLDEPVDKVLIEKGKAVGVKTANRTLAADAVVVNADFAGAMRRMVPNQARNKWTDERLAKKRFSCSTFMMYLGIDGRYDDVSHHTIFLARDYKQNLKDIEEVHQLSDDPSFYVQNACVTDRSLAPDGQSTLYVLLPVTHEAGKVDWTKEAPRYRQLALKQMEKIGLHDVERRIRTEKILTPTGWADDFDLYKGATFSMAHSLDQMLHLRPHNRFEDVGKMYLVGGGTHPGSGLPVIFESARITSRLLLEDLKMEPHWTTNAGAGSVLSQDELVGAIS
ncbi:phytoene desaturase family protein [Granulicella sibirica]|uniref:Phytoene desaturase, neurosporene or lycopene producing n=1 Tax=Granulicella sibirica TaxID=2479048 RepID=A0A4Q0T596_9BACT|nr:phytoene desaturase family protein [Granulicella sibirica]RXH56786.1 Phytoene desaturase, neurosporene or lycopene producing [Granulicella sibirica]